jgi:hypothetical protein
MAGLKVPIITILVGEGGSGGALGIAMGNKIGMLSGGYYGVITPEGAASILCKYKNDDEKQQKFHHDCHEISEKQQIYCDKLKGHQVIDEIIELYKANNYSHVKTYKDFKDKYKDHDKYKKLSYATLQLFVEAAGLPWNNELNKKTFVFACIDTKKRVQEGDRMRDKLAVEANTSDLKYRIECESQAQADALVDHIWSRFKNDHETEFKAYLATRSKREREAPGAMRIKWMIEHGLYDEYLDLSQYDLSTIKIPKKSLGGEGSSGWKIASRGGFLGILYNSESTDDQKVEELLETTFSYTP